MFPDREWSGTAFYRFIPKEPHSTSLQEGHLELVDFLLQDIGSSVYTEYEINDQAAGYYADHIDRLQGCHLALLHSHNKMQAFFSGTDLQTLHTQAAQCSNCLSIIVNNEGSYVAVFTEAHKIEAFSDILTTTTEENSFSFMGTAPLTSSRQFQHSSTETEVRQEIHCYDCLISCPTEVGIHGGFQKVCLALKEQQEKKEAEEKERNTSKWAGFPPTFAKSWSDDERELFFKGFPIPESPTDKGFQMADSICSLSLTWVYYDKLNPPINELNEPNESTLLFFLKALFTYYSPTPTEVTEVKKCLQGISLKQELRDLILFYLDDYLNNYSLNK